MYETALFCCQFCYLLGFFICIYNFYFYDIANYYNFISNLLLFLHSNKTGLNDLSSSKIIWSPFVVNFTNKLTVKTHLVSCDVIAHIFNNGKWSAHSKTYYFLQYMFAFLFSIFHYITKIRNNEDKSPWFNIYVRLCLWINIVT